MKKKSIPLSLLRESISRTEPARNFVEAIVKDVPSIIAEIKRFSPSRGPIWEDLVPQDLGLRYEYAGASAISVLTDERFFKGSLEDLTSVHKAVSLPCLRKEFIIDEYQIYESRANLADSILLIVRILDESQLKDYIYLSRDLGMEPLVEVHTEKEIEYAIQGGAKILGINNRDLDTLQVDVQVTIRLQKLIPYGYIVVSESGINHPDTIKELFSLGVNAFLIGESILLSRKPEEFISWLLAKL